ncbi:MAG: acyl-CoA desaturase, partial [Flavobacteriaceae bacterium]
MEKQTTNKPLRFSRKDPKKFFQTLNKRVNDYFKEHKAPKTGNWRLYLKTAFMFSLLVAPYFLIL